MNDIEFWKTEGINYLYWHGAPKYYEGEDNIRNVVELVGENSVREIGCGYGRLSTFFDPTKYTGYDISATAIKKAHRLFPNYRFIHWDFSELEQTSVTIFVNGPHLVPDDQIEETITMLCKSTNAVIIGEPMDPSWRGAWKHLPYGVYTRSLETYDELFKSHRFYRTATKIGNHLTLQRPYTVARWELT